MPHITVVLCSLLFPSPSVVQHIFAMSKIYHRFSVSLTVLCQMPFCVQEIDAQKISVILKMLIFVKTNRVNDLVCGGGKGFKKEKPNKGK